MKERYLHKDITRMHRFFWKSSQMIWETRNTEFIVEEYLSASILIQQFFSFEAYLNFIGASISPKKWEEEKDHFNTNFHGNEKGTLGKFWFLSQKCQCLNQWKLGENPYQFMVKLRDMRNILAHPKPIINEEEVMRNPNKMPAFVKNFIDIDLKFKNVKIGFEAVQQVCQVLHDRANEIFSYDPNEKNPLLGSYRVLEGSSLD